MLKLGKGLFSRMTFLQEIIFDMLKEVKTYKWVDSDGGC